MLARNAPEDGAKPSLRAAIPPRLYPHHPKNVLVSRAPAGNHPVLYVSSWGNARVVPEIGLPAYITDIALIQIRRIKLRSQSHTTYPRG